MNLRPAQKFDLLMLGLIVLCGVVLYLLPVPKLMFLVFFPPSFIIALTNLIRDGHYTE